MIHLMFGIKDLKAEAFLPIFPSSTVGMAKRVFMEHVNNPESQFNKYPEDFVLFEIGEFDDSTGILAPCNLRHLGTASDYREQTKETTR